MVEHAETENSAGDKHGNADISTNAFASYYAQEAYNKEDKSKQIGVFQGRLENPDLKWETTTEWNVGLDFGFFNSRISGSVEYYYKVISDLLNYKPLNSYQTITQVIANIGKTQSTGVEVTLNTKNIVTKRLFLVYRPYFYKIQRSLERTYS